MTPKIRPPSPLWAVRACLLITRGHKTGDLWNAETMYWSIQHPPLTEGLEVTGQIELTLYAASTAPDTDFTATLVDVHPGGKAINICEGIVRARFRNSYEEPTLIEPETICAYKIILWETSNLSRRGTKFVSKSPVVTSRALTGTKTPAVHRDWTPKLRWRIRQSIITHNTLLTLHYR